MTHGVVFRMRSIQRALGLAVLLVACRDGSRQAVIRQESAALPKTTTTSCAGPFFDGDGIGALRIGATVDSVRRSCRVVRDTTEMRAEGLPVRILAVAALGDTVEAEVDSGRVWRIAVTSARFRTTDSLGVGVPIGRLLAVPGIRGLTGEGTLYLVSPTHCGLSFRVTNPQRALRADWTLPLLKRLPATSVVTQVLVLGCKTAA